MVVVAIAAPMARSFWRYDTGAATGAVTGGKGTGAEDAATSDTGVRERTAS